MSRAEGFEVMDVSTAILHDPKFRRLARESPAHLAPGFMAYMATMAESWKAGEKVSVEDAWPPYLAFDEGTVEALQGVRLIDARGQIQGKSWRGWFEPARERREKVRERWRRANLNRHGEATTTRPNGAEASTNDSGGDSAGTATLPRGSRDDSGANHSVPSVDSDSGATTPPNPPRSRGGRNGRTRPAGDPPGMTGNVTDYDSLMRGDEDIAWLRDRESEVKP